MNSTGRWSRNTGRRLVLKGKPSLNPTPRIQHRCENRRGLWQRNRELTNASVEIPPDATERDIVLEAGAANKTRQPGLCEP
ncbi:hypothetical protein BaRGS_00020463 [Batillaria attramentaria]|uniref:Uncharacterized protein n=1 Tax=Batillaria attramentaria TaxID=370345 RepID=A0ABD0KMN6_9CAEN